MIEEHLIVEDASRKQEQSSVPPPHGDPAIGSEKDLTKINQKLVKIFGSDHGPRPITIEQYKKRNSIQNVAPPVPKKRRGGKLVAARQEISNLKRLVKLAKNADEKLRFLRMVKEAQLKEKARRKEKNIKKDPILDKLFDNLFKLEEQHKI